MALMVDRLDELVRREPVTNVTVESAPITINTPEQKPPVVNVTVEGQKPTTRRVLRDKKGAITGIEDA